MKLAPAFALMLAATPVLAQFKCTGADGAVSFQQQPCAAQAKTERLTLPTPVDNARSTQSAEMKEADARVKEAAEAVRRARAVEAAVHDRHCANKRFDRVTVGMPVDDVFCVPGYRRPVTFNRTITEAGESVQYVYEVGARRTYVYMKNGKVNAIQD